MKKIKIFLLGGLLLIASACEFGDTNVSPAIPADVSAQAIVPAAQAGLAWVVGGELVRLSGLFTQQFIGINAQQASNYVYLFIPADSDGIWFRSYVSTLQPLFVILEKAEAEGSNHTAAMAKILIAHGIGSLSDIFGDVPFSEAFGARDGEFFPSYDTHESVHAAVHTLLDEAITSLAGAAGDGPELGADDLIFSGNTASWTAAAYSLKAKYYMRTTNVNAAAYGDAETALANAIASNAGDFQISFGTAATEANPAYQFSQDRGGNINFDPSFVALLSGDPRESVILTAIGDDTYDAGTFYTDIDAPVVFTSFAEMKFIEAEIELMENGDIAAAEAALAAAISASITKLTGSDDAVFAATNSALAGLADDAARLEQIIGQKYIALYSHGIEAWSDFRRTGYPALTPVAGGSNSFNLNGEIPRSIPYPQTEIDLNLSNVPNPEANLQTQLYWDTQ